MTDVRMLATDDGGDMEIVNGTVTMTDLVETAVLLSLFGGNERDSGSQADDRKQFWGNLVEANPAFHYRSETQHLLLELPAIPANLRRLEDAAARDLQWFTDEGIATNVLVTVSMPGLNRVHFEIDIEIDGRKHTVSIDRPWQAAA